MSNSFGIFLVFIYFWSTSFLSTRSKAFKKSINRTYVQLLGFEMSFKMRECNYFTAWIVDLPGINPSYVQCAYVHILADLFMIFTFISYILWSYDIDIYINLTIFNPFLYIWVLKTFNSKASFHKCRQTEIPVSANGIAWIWVKCYIAGCLTLLC
jgi:hypothetical protein